MYDIAIIGAGPGGYVSAIRAAQLGAKVVLVEKSDLGGTCLNRGCIPSKTLLSAADKLIELKKLKKFGIDVELKNVEIPKIVKRKDITVLKLRKGIENLLKANDVDVLVGEAKIINENSLKVGEEVVEFKNLIIATGAQPADLPHIKHDGEFTLNSDDILTLPDYPESILVVGSGAIGVEWARIFSGLGKKVTLVDIAEKLSPTSDGSVSEYLQKEFKQNKIVTHLSTGIEKIEEKKVFLTSGDILEPDIVLLATGRKPNLDILKNLDVATERGFVTVDNNFRTNIPNIYAVGDVNGLMQLAHVASHQGVLAVEHIIQGKNSSMNYSEVPFVIYGKPEIASVGKNAEDGDRVSVFPLNILGKSMADDETEGFVKIIAKDDIIVGAHIVAKEASSLIHVLALALKEKITVSKLKEFVFAHPTYAEGLHEAILGVDGEAIHLPPAGGQNG